MAATTFAMIGVRGSRAAIHSTVTSRLMVRAHSRSRSLQPEDVIAGYPNRTELWQSVGKGNTSLHKTGRDGHNANALLLLMRIAINPGPAHFGQCAKTIQSAIATIMTFSVKDTNPSGTRLEPPTQAHLMSRRSM